MSDHPDELGKPEFHVRLPCPACEGYGKVIVSGASWRDEPPWWDWKEAGWYSLLERQLSNSHRGWWIWQFIRRNDEYRGEWQALVPLVEYRPAEPPKRGPLVEIRVPAQPPDPTTRDQSYARALESGIPGQPPRLAGFDCSRWSLSRYVHPGHERLPYPARLAGTSSPLIVFRDERPEPPAGTVWVQVNLRRPLGKQMRAAEASLQGVRKEQGIPTPREIKTHQRLWSRYLRLLDAHAAGATPQEMADLLAEENADGTTTQDVRKQLGAARRLTRPAVYIPLI